MHEDRVAGLEQASPEEHRNLGGGAAKTTESCLDESCYLVSQPMDDRDGSVVAVQGGGEGDRREFDKFAPWHFLELHGLGDLERPLKREVSRHSLRQKSRGTATILGAASHCEGLFADILSSAPVSADPAHRVEPHRAVAIDGDAIDPGARDDGDPLARGRSGAEQSKGVVKDHSALGHPGLAYEPTHPFLLDWKVKAGHCEGRRRKVHPNPHCVVNELK
nr:hypothetical protein [Cryobacterium sp. TMT2-4]